MRETRGTKQASGKGGRAAAARSKRPAGDAKPALLTGGNPQIAKADGDAPVQAYIAAMTGWKRGVGRRLDALVVRTVPGVRKAVKWNSPFYGVEDRGWFLSFHTFTHYVKVTFFQGTSLRPVPGGGKAKDARWIDVREDDLDESQLVAWIRQAAALPGWGGAPRSPAPQDASRGQSSPPPRSAAMHPDTVTYNASLTPDDRAICDLLAGEIARNLPEAENKVWHAHPVWFLEGNPVVGYSKLKGCVRLLFWSGRSFGESGLREEGSFQAAEARYTAAGDVDTRDLGRWLAKSRDIQWDYKNLVRRKGRLERLK